MGRLTTQAKKKLAKALRRVERTIMGDVRRMSMQHTKWKVIAANKQ